MGGTQVLQTDPTPPKLARLCCDGMGQTLGHIFTLPFIQRTKVSEINENIFLSQSYYSPMKDKVILKGAFK